MKAGDVTMIYFDPINLRVPEGLARLVEKIDGNEFIELWNVVFLNGENKQICTRLIGAK